MKIVVEAVDNASRVFDNVKKEVWAMEKETRKGLNNMSKNFKRTSDQIKSRAEQNSWAFQDMALYWGIAFGAITAWSISARNSANNLNESINAVNVVFGDASATILDFAKNSANSVWLAQSEFQQLSTWVGTLLKATWQDINQVADNTITLTQRASDLASVFNTDVNLALSAIEQALRGETEAIRAFWSDVTDASLEQFLFAQGIDKSVSELTQQEKTLLRMQKVMSDTAQVQGDFTNTIDSNANQNRILQAETENLSAKLGTTLIPIFDQINATIRPIISSVAEWIERNPELTKNIIMFAWAASWLVFVLWTIWLAVPVITTWITALWTALTLATWPIWLVVLWITALFVAYQTNFLWIKDIVNNVISWMRDNIPPIWNAIVDDIWKTLTWIQEKFWFVLDVIKWLRNTALALLSGDRSLARETISNTMMTYIDWILAFFGTSLLTIQTKFIERKEIFVWLFTNTWQSVKMIFVTKRNEIKKFFTDSIAFVTSYLWWEGMSLMSQAFTNMMSGVAWIVKGVINDVIWWFEFLVNSAINMVNRLIDALNAVAERSQWLIPTISRIWNVTLPRFAGGGMVDNDTIKWFWQQFAWWWMVTWPQGIDRVPAMLTAWEVVLNAAQQERVAAQLQSRWQGNTFVFNFSPTVMWTEESYVEELWDKMVSYFKRHTNFESF